MKNTRFTTNTLLGIIAINLTLITLIQLDIFPPKVYANENTSMPINSNYGLVPLNEDGSIDVKLTEETINAIKPPSVMDVNLSAIRGRTPGMYHRLDLGWGLVVKTN